MKDQMNGGPGYLTKKRVSDDMSMCALEAPNSMAPCRNHSSRKVRWQGLAADDACQPQPCAKEEAPHQLAACLQIRDLLFLQQD